MYNNLNLINSKLRGRELQRQAEHWRRGHAAVRGDHGHPAARDDDGVAPAVVLAELPSTVVIRMAGSDDERALSRLAQLDGGPRRQRLPVLVAEVDGEILAALPLNRGAALADPFRPTASLLEMLKLRVAQLRDCEQPRPGLLSRLFNLLRGSGGRRRATAPATPGNAGMLIPRD